MKKISLLSFVVFVGTSISFAQNASYDVQGRLTSDPANHISLIEWNNNGTVSRVVAKNAEVEFNYDEGGNRMRKLVKPKDDNGIMAPSSWTYTYYQYDAFGKEIARYTRNIVKQEADTFIDEFAVKDHTINEGRQNFERTETKIETSFTATESSVFNNIIYKGIITPVSRSEARSNRGQKNYELTNHGKSIIGVVSDRKKDGAIELLSAQDYYPFGMTQADRNYEQGNYAFGFAGKESDAEILGAHNSYDFGARLYNPQIGRWWSVDAKAAKYPQASPYTYGGNSPIQNGDFDGNDITWLTNKNFVTSGNPKLAKEYQKRIEATKELIKKVPEANKVFQEAENNHNIQVLITFHDYGAYVDDPFSARTVNLGRNESAELVKKETENGTTYTLSDDFARYTKNMHLLNFDVTEYLRDAKKVFFVQASMILTGGLSNSRYMPIIPAYSLASSLVHEVEAHINLPQRNNNYYKQYAPLYSIMTEEEIEHLIWGSQSSNFPVLNKDGKYELVLDPYTTPGSMARRIFTNLFYADTNFHEKGEGKDAAHLLEVGYMNMIEQQKKEAAEKKEAQPKK